MALTAGLVGSVALGGLLYSGVFGTGSDSTGSSSSSKGKKGKQTDSRDAIRIEPSALRDVASSALRRATGSKNESQMVCAIFWDVDNCSPPAGYSGREVAQAIRKTVQETIIEDDDGNKSRGGTIISFKAYLELSTADFTPNAAVVQLRSELQGSGVSLIDTPKSGRKNASDFMLAADMLAFAIDVPPPARIFLVSGDRDFAYGLGTLRNRGYEVVLVVPPIGAAPILQASANKVLRWRQDVLKVTKDSWGVNYDSDQPSSIPPKPAQPASQPAQTLAPPVPNKQANGTTMPKTSPPAIAKKFDSDTSNQSQQNQQQQTPPDQSQMFASLVAVLQRFAKEGQPRPLRSATAIRLVTSDPKVYERAGATRWAEFAAVAEANGLVTLGSDGTPGSEWIQLKSKAPVVPKQTREAASESQKAPTNTPLSRTASQPSAQQTPSKNAKYASSANEAFGPDLDDVPVEHFYPLIEAHKSVKSTGQSRPLASDVHRQLSAMQSLGTDVYGKAGCKDFKEYMSLAKRYGVARLRETDEPNVFTVQIHPKFAEIYTSQITTSLGRIVDTTINRNDVAARPNAALAAKLSKAAAKEAAKNAAIIDDREASPDGDTSKGRAPHRNSHTASYDPKAKGQNVINGKTYPEEFVLLVLALLDQREEGRFYSVDSFLQKLLNKLGVKGIKKGEDFANYLARAEKAQVVELQPGFIPNTQHVRLHWSLVPPSGPVAASSYTGADEGQDNGVSRNNATDGLNSWDATLTPAQVAAATARRGEASRRRRAKAVWDARVSGEDRARFWPLVGTLLTIYQTEGSPAAARSRLSGEVPKRFPLDDAGAWTGAWYQAHGVNGFWEYATLAADKGYVKIVDKEDRGHEQIAIGDAFFHDMCIA